MRGAEDPCAKRRTEDKKQTLTCIHMCMYIYIHTYITRCQSQVLFSCHMIFFGIIRPTPSNRRNGLPGDDSYSKVSQLLAPWGCVCVFVCSVCRKVYIYTHTYTWSYNCCILNLCICKVFVASFYDLGLYDIVVLRSLCSEAFT